MESSPGSRAQPLPVHWATLPWPRPTPAALLTVLVRAAESFPGYAQLRATTGVAAMATEEFGDDEAFVTETWLRAWVRRHRSVAVRAWLREQNPGWSPEVVTAAVRDLSVAVALAVVDVEVLVVGLRDGWSDEWVVAVHEAGFGAAEASDLHARGDGWDVVNTMRAFTGS